MLSRWSYGEISQQKTMKCTQCCCETSRVFLDFPPIYHFRGFISRTASFFDPRTMQFLSKMRAGILRAQFHIDLWIQVLIEITSPSFDRITPELYHVLPVGEGGAGLTGIRAIGQGGYADEITSTLFTSPCVGHHDHLVKVQITPPVMPLLWKKIWAALNSHYPNTA